MHRTDKLLTQAELDIKRAVVTMLSLKLQSGSSPQELEQFASDCVSIAIGSFSPTSNREMVWLYQIARILRTWHLETRFLTMSGLPKPLKLNGVDGLRNLILCHFPPRMIGLVIATMRRNGLIRAQRSGHWVPTSRIARTPRPTIELLSHFAEGVSRLAETVGKNTTTNKKGDLLLERAAQVNDLPLRDASAFRKFVRVQGMAFLTTIDDWLESRSRSNTNKKGPVCNAGVFTFAFVDDRKQAKKGRVT